ncbi:hypothetical protein GCM10007352_20440 [Mucilaginibacter phyllosphaerae]|nr:hypothetical protein GCM10007352_20440 [Mucilaginibacter phyllosphaerae]
MLVTALKIEVKVSPISCCLFNYKSNEKYLLIFYKDEILMKFFSGVNIGLIQPLLINNINSFG